MDGSLINYRLVSSRKGWLYPMDRTHLIIFFSFLLFLLWFVMDGWLQSLSLIHYIQFNRWTIMIYCCLFKANLKLQHTTSRKLPQDTFFLFLHKWVLCEREITLGKWFGQTLITVCVCVCRLVSDDDLVNWIGKLLYRAESINSIILHI